MCAWRGHEPPPPPSARHYTSHQPTRAQSRKKAVFSVKIVGNQKGVKKWEGAVIDIYGADAADGDAYANVRF